MAEEARRDNTTATNGGWRHGARKTKKKNPMLRWKKKNDGGCGGRNARGRRGKHGEEEAARRK